MHSSQAYHVAPAYFWWFHCIGALHVCPRWGGKPTETQDTEELPLHYDSWRHTTFMLFQLPLEEPILVYFS